MIISDLRYCEEICDNATIMGGIWVIRPYIIPEVTKPPVPFVNALSIPPIQDWINNQEKWTISFVGSQSGDGDFAASGISKDGNSSFSIAVNTYSFP